MYQFNGSDNLHFLKIEMRLSVQLSLCDSMHIPLRQMIPQVFVVLLTCGNESDFAYLKIVAFVTIAHA